METPTTSIRVKKTLVGSLTKSSLTPCRRPGLSRLSSRSLHKPCTTDVTCTPNVRVQEDIVINRLESESSSTDDSTPKLNRDERHEASLKQSDAQNKHSAFRKVRRCLTVTPVKVEGAAATEDVLESVFVGEDSQMCKKIKLNPKRINCHEEVETFSVSNFEDSSTRSHVTDNSVVQREEIDELDNSDVIVTAEVIEKLVKSIQDKKKKLEQLKVQDTYAKKHNLEELRAQTAKWKKAGQEALVYSVSLAKHAGYSVTTKELMSQHGFPIHLMGYNSENDEFE